MSQALVRIAAGWLLGLMLAVAGAIVSVNLVNNSVASPQQPVREYLDALQKGEGERALGLLRASVPEANAAMLDGTALQTAAARISDVKLGGAEARGGNRVMVPMDYTIDGSQLRTEFLLERTGTEWLFFHKWAFVPAALPTVDVTVVNSNEATLNGVPVNMPGGRNTFAVFYPGEYEASLNGQYFSAPPTRATVSGRDAPRGTAEPPDPGHGRAEPGGGRQGQGVPGHVRRGGRQAAAASARLPVLPRHQQPRGGRDHQVEHHRVPEDQH